MELQNAQYQAIMRDYEKRQIRNHDIETERKNEIYSKIPEYKNICELISHLSISCAKERISGKKDTLEDLKAKIDSLIKRKEELLLSNGYSKDYLEPVYTCNDCKDTGYIGNEKCHCLKQAIISQLYKQSNIKELLEKENFTKFSLDLYPRDFVDAKTGKSARETIEGALKVANDFIETFDDEFQNLFIYGDVGVGKSFLSNCIACELLNRGHSVLYFSSSNFFTVLADSTFDRNDHEAAYAKERILDADLLVIDDLGTEFNNSFSSSQFFACINERLLNRKSTIISTNLTLNTLKDQYSERSFSRITSNYKMLKLIGNDLRIVKKLKRKEK